MLAPYGLLLPTALPPLVQVPLDFDGPFEMPAEPSTTTAPSKDEEKGNKNGEPRQQHSLETKPSFISHSTRNHHVNLNNMIHKVHMPAFHRTNGHPTQMPQTQSSIHLPHITLPNLPWTHHSTTDYVPPTTSWIPRADIRETQTAYFIEIEVPGLSAGSEDQVLVQWMTPRTIVVSGDIQRSPLPVKSGAEAESSNFTKAATEVAEEPDLEPLQRVPSAASDDDKTKSDVCNAPTPAFLLCERHVGYWRRSFTLPADVDLDIDPSQNSSGRPLEYWIEAGVLIIRAPKVKK